MIKKTSYLFLKDSSGKDDDFMFIKTKNNLLLVAFALIISSCQGPKMTPHQSLQPLTVAEGPIDQIVSEEIKMMLNNEKNVTKVHAVNTFKSLVVAFELRPLSRLKAKQYTERFKQKIKRLYPMFEIIV